MRVRTELIRTDCGWTSYCNGLLKKFLRRKTVFLPMLMTVAVMITSGLRFIPDNSTSDSKVPKNPNEEVLTVIPNIHNLIDNWNIKTSDVLRKGNDTSNHSAYWKSDNEKNNSPIKKSDDTRDQIYIIQQEVIPQDEVKELFQKTGKIQTKDIISPKDKQYYGHDEEDKVLDPKRTTDKVQEADTNEGENFPRVLDERTRNEASQEVSPPKSVPKPVEQIVKNQEYSKSPRDWDTEVNDLRSESDDRRKELCAPFSIRNKGPIKPFLTAPSLQQLESEHPELSEGGRYSPPDCTARTRLAVVVPYRDRKSHLPIFFRNMHPFLQRQDLDYTIFVVQQSPELSFNKASLMNIAFIEAMKMDDFDCFIFHDVDLMPEDDRISYTCKSEPRHLSVAVNTLSYKLPYKDIFGGVVAMTPSDFYKVNGFSNRYWGWGAEDDDMANRIFYHELGILRPPPQIARYTMIPHKKEKGSAFRHRHLHKGVYYFNKDGVKTVNYELLALKKLKLFTWIYVKLFYRR